MIRTRKETLPKRRINPPLIWINVRCPGIGLEWAREPWWRHPDGAVRRRPVCGRPVARPVPGRDGRQHDALRADVRRFRAGPGRRRHGAAAGRPALRVAAHRARRAASLPSRTPDDVRRSWRAMRCRDRLAAAVRHRVGGAAAVGRRAVAGARGAGPARAGSRARRLDARCRTAWRSGPAVVSRSASYSASCPAASSTRRWPTAAAAGNPALGALGMLAFGLGTTPALVAVGIAGHAAGRRWQRGVAKAAPAVMALNAALLAVLAVRGLVIDL